MNLRLDQFKKLTITARLSLFVAALLLVTIGITINNARTRQETRTSAASSTTKNSANTDNTSQTGTEKLSVYSLNPHYFQDKNGNPVYMIGYYTFSFHRDSSSDWKKLLDYHNQYRINYVRIINEVKDAGGYDDNPYQRVAGTANPRGHEKFDLTLWNETYWTKLKSFLSYAESKEVYVHISLWDHISYKSRADEWAWLGTGWNIDNNVNSVLFGDIDRNNDGDAIDSNEFYDYDALINATTDSQRLNVAKYQKRYVDRLLNETCNYSNVFYELGNEVEASYNWIKYWVDYTKARCNNIITIDDDHAVGFDPLTEANIDGATYHGAGLNGSNLSSAWASSAYSYNRWLAADTDGNAAITGDAIANRKAAWIAFVTGGHWMDYSDNNEAWVNSDGTTTYDFTGKAAYWKYLQNFISSRDIRFWQMVPHDELATSGRTFADPTKEYIIYLPEGGSTTVNLFIADTLSVEWYDPRAGTYQDQTTIQGGASRTFTAPDSKDWVLHIKVSNPSSPSPTPTSISTPPYITPTLYCLGLGINSCMTLAIQTPIPSTTQDISGPTPTQTPSKNTPIIGGASLLILLISGIIIYYKKTRHESKI